MRLPTEAGRESKDKKSKEGRYQANAIKLVVSILPAHTAACNIYGTTRSEQMGDGFPLRKYIYNISFPATHAYFPALELCSPKMCIGG